VRPLIAAPGRRATSVPILRYSATLAAEAICEAIWAAGGEPLVLHGPDGTPGAEITRRLSRFDGLVVPGGADMNPARYGQQPIPETVDWVDHQDDFESAVIASALETGLPSLVICRGMQVLNVVQGGTLIQHLPFGSVQHDGAVHQVNVVRGSHLRGIVGLPRIQVSSYHHQAIDLVGKDLTVTAIAGDGTIEAVEHSGGTIIGVQWHPEDHHQASPSDAALFADVVERARRRASS
jgi:putative glutamine amidotransferase